MSRYHIASALPMILVAAPKKLYHGTFGWNAESLAKEGILPDRQPNWGVTDPGYVYLTDSAALASNWVREAYEIGDVELDWDRAEAAVFEVDTSQLEMSRLKRDPKGGPSDWRYAGPVPPEAVKLAYVDDYTDDIELDADMDEPPEPVASRWWRVAEQLGADAGPVASFDFDDVLHYAPGGDPIDFWNWESYVPREPYLAELRRLASEGYRIIIVSHRDPGMEGPILQFAGRHGLPLDEVHCIGIGGPKREVLEDKGAVLHYDDSPYLAEELRDSNIKFVQVRQTGEGDLSWVPDEMWEQYPAYSRYADMVGADKPV